MSSFDRDHPRVQAALVALAGPDRDALLVHLRECGECSRALAGVQDALLAALYLPPREAMDARRGEEVRARLLDRAGAPARDRTPRRAAPVTGAGGWLVAAGLATVLLAHHALHRPLRLGWLVAAGLTIALFGAALHIRAERRRSATVRERLSALEAELARVRAHALGADPALGTA